MHMSFEDLSIGGYFLTRPIVRPDYVSADLMPVEFLSMSGCLAQFAPDVWSLAWASVDDNERSRNASEIGMQPSVLPEAIAYATAEFDRSWGWPNVIYELTYARDFAGRFLADVADLRLIGLALHGDFVGEFLEEAKPGPREGANGLYERLQARSGPAAGGKPLGWEILGFEHTPLHSWLCNGLEREVFEKLGIAPARNGLIADAESARVAAAHCGKEEVRAEPALWQPWLLIEYPLSS